MPSDNQLRRWYLKYNRLYFEDHLPSDTCIWWEVTSGAYADCILENGVWRIRINPSLAGWPQLAKFSLLHELVHLKLHPYLGHGKRFNAEMLILAEKGALNDLW
jgi:hypothetical protein